IPNLLDAILGRIATGKERQQGKASDNCNNWRKQLLMDPEFLECKLFRKQSTAVYQDLWPYITVFSKLNSETGENGAAISRDAKRILNYLKKEGSSQSDVIKKALRYSSSSEARQFLKAKAELQSLLILTSCEDSDCSSRSTLCLWENAVPKSVRSAADKISCAEAGAKLLSAALTSSVLVNEKQLPKLFNWANGESADWAKYLLESRTFMRVPRKNDNWIVPRRVLSK
ncbi:MAG TPA: hypothetical protein VLH08_01965, partial [Acidobacteriota bacterium]|nr:hypothetical protein [Acidobacteriota bacterium]